MRRPTDKPKSLSDLRANIWEIAADYSLSEQDLIQHLLDRIGEMINCSRVCFSVPQNSSGKKGIVCVQEWLNRDVRPAVGYSVPAILKDHFKELTHTEITREKALEFIRPVFRPLIKPIVSKLIKDQDIDTVTIFPYYVHSKVEGWFTIDVCHSADFKPVITDEIQAIMDEVIHIVSLHREKKEAEEKLQQAYNQMEQKVKERTLEVQRKNRELIKKDEEILEQNRILETSLEILSHDTRNIYMGLYVMLKEMEDQELAAVLKENIDELYEMTMESAGILESKKRIQDLVEMIGSIRCTSERVTVKDFPRVELRARFTPNLFAETSSLFKNAIGNLIENGLKYSPGDEKVIIDVSIQESLIRIDVIDHGPGISDQDKLRVFDKFYRTGDSRVEGTGRGLWITKNLIEKDGGSLTVMDNPPGGSLFRVEIPMYRLTAMKKGKELLAGWFNLTEEAVQKRLDATEILLHYNEDEVVDRESALFNILLRELRSENRKKSISHIKWKMEQLMKLNPEGSSVLIVDDSVYVHYYLARYLTELGYRIAGFALNGEEGIRQYKKLNPELVTLDHTMPVKNGIETAVELIRINRRQPILFVTAAGELKVFQQELAKKVTHKQMALLTKPLTRKQLSAALHELEESSN